MDLITFHPDLVVLTNEVSNRSITWPEYDHVLLNGGELSPIVVSRINRNFQPAYIVLDGNHRACLWAKHNQNISAYALTKETTTDEIFEMEGTNLIHRFPHREFLCGDETFRSLMKRAIKAALALNESIPQALARIQRTG